MTPFGTFFLPGPTEVRPDVLAAMSRPMMGHRSKAFEAIYSDVASGLKVVFGTQHPVLIATASATALMEAGIRALPPGPVLAIVNGAFSERFARIAAACGRAVTTLRVPDGRVASAAELDEALAKGAFVGATVVHSETSTGALSDLATLRTVAARHGVSLIVDSVTGVAGAPLEADAWQLPYVLTGSQKALALPPGLAFAAVQPEFLAQSAQGPDRGLYLDVVEMASFAAKQQTPNTPAVSLFYAAQVQLAAIVREGMSARVARHAAMAEMTWRWVDEASARLGVPLSIAAPAGARSPTVTAIVLPPELPPGDVVKGVLSRGFTIGSGYGALKDTTVRIGHMGDHTVDRLTLCLDAVEETLRALLAR